MSNRKSSLVLCLLISFAAVTIGCKKNNPSTAAAIQVTAAFAADKPIGDSPVTVKFTNASINGFSYLWDFGDHATSTEKDSVHTSTNPANSKFQNHIRLIRSATFKAVTTAPIR